MKITVVGHASLLTEVGGITLLSDPWWRGPCFGAQWWNYPLPRLDVVQESRIDYVYVSHGHHDHFHPGTLKTLDRSAKVLVSREVGLAAHVRELGFEVIEIGADESYSLTDKVSCRIIPTHGDDTLMCVSDGAETCINLNDALHSAARDVQARHVSRLRALYPVIDYVFCGYGIASHFPNCYEIPGKDREATAAQRQHYFNGQWAWLIHELNPRFGFPFAADVALLEDDLFWSNEPGSNAERPTAAFHAQYPASGVQVIDVAPGFCIEDGLVLADIRRPPFAPELARQQLADSVSRANRYGGVDRAGIDEVVALMRANLAISEDYLKSHEGNFRFMVELRNSSAGIGFYKHGRDLRLFAVDDVAREPAADVVYRTRLHYLKWSLTMPHGDEILFVGSGGVFAYRNRVDAENNLHREFMLLLRTQSEPPRPRYGGSSKAVYAAKKLIKKALGRDEVDLYDLRQWTVFDAARETRSTDAR